MDVLKIHRDAVLLEPADVLYGRGTSWTTPIVTNLAANNYDRILNLALDNFPSKVEIGVRRDYLNIDAGSLWAEFQVLIQTLKKRREDEALRTLIRHAVLDRIVQSHSCTFTLDEILDFIDGAQNKPESHIDPCLLWLLHQELSGQSAIIQLIYAVCRLLLRILFIPRAAFCGLSWSKRPWCLLHGSHPPKMSAPAVVLGCA
jgi:hypothetical protein